jgi:carboxyl-terminal processing protease
MRRPAKAALVLAAVSAGVAGLLLHAGLRHPMASRAAPPRSSAAPAAPGSAASRQPSAEDSGSRPLKLPSGAPAILSCSSARSVIAQVRAKLAQPVATPSPSAFADATVDWLDPHGLWSAAPDAPAKTALRQHAAALLRELESPPGDPSPCDTARELAAVTESWVKELRTELDRAENGARHVSRDRAFSLASEGVFQDDPVTRPARELARDLGARVGAFERVYGDAAQAPSAATSRFAPDFGLETWTGVILCAAVRAYVPLVDPHGQWAPLDEEWSLYAADPALDGEPRLWGRMMRTALGVRVQEDPAPPLISGDLVLSVGGVPTAGLSVEQIDQLSHLESVAGEHAREVVVLRRHEVAPRKVEVEIADDADEPAAELGTRRVPFGDGDVMVVNVPDVPDDLGEELEQVIAALADGPKQPLGLILDLRGNGGGSIDGAAGAIGVFLPGAPSFPLRRRGGEVEVEHADAPPRETQWHGPVAALVDGYTASAAEMIAGALATYRRGPLIGSRTFGKGCIQEYFDDRASVGVLRLTTMLFSLPDGSALQGVGITPNLLMPMQPTNERERVLSGSLQPWQGPDVRAKASIGGPDWPAHHARVGPCQDAILCAALSRLGSPAAIRRSASNFQGRAARRGGP